MPTLLLLSGPHTGEQLPIVGERFTLGRLKTSPGVIGCDAVIDDYLTGTPPLRADSVSRKHAIISFANGQWYIEDGDGEGKRSRNGTYVNDKKIQYPDRVRLRDRDRIRICDLRFSFHLDPDSTFAVEASISHSDSHLSLHDQPADRLRILLEVSASLRGTLDSDALLNRTLDHLFQLFGQAERGLVVIREGASGALTVRALRTPQGTPADARFSTSVVRQCLESVEAVLGNDLPGQFPESDSIGGLPVRSLMCAPLWTPEGLALGAIQLDTRAGDRKFTPDDLKLLLGVANQASMALSNARLHHESLAYQRRARDMELAQQVQRALLPRSLPEVAGYAFHAYYAAAEEVGGDSYDFVRLPGGRLGVLLGDVSGHGVAAALVMARFGAEARACLEAEPDLAAAITRLNSLVVRAAVPDSFVTFAAVVLDPATHTVVTVNAGHPAPLLRRADGTVVELASSDISGLPLGIIDGPRYLSCEQQLQPGESVLLFSDGLTEAMDGGDKQFGASGVHSVLAVDGCSPHVVGEALAAAVAQHTAGHSQSDDITLVCFCRLP